MIFLKKASAPFTPKWYPPGEGPIFMIRAGDLAERQMLEAELEGQHDAGRVYRLDIEAAFDAGCERLLADAPEELAALQELLAQEREIEKHNSDLFVQALGVAEADRVAFIAESSRHLPDGDRQQLAEVRRLIREHWPDYRALLAQQARREALVPLLCFKRFCTGWEGVDLDFAAGVDGQVTDDSARAVRANDLQAAGLHAYGLLYAADVKATEKNSSARSKSVARRRRSTSGASSRKAGSSQAKGGSRTRA